jgi:hypothetical protein
MMITDYDRSGESHSWANALDGLDLASSFITALSRSSVINSDCPRAAGRWLLSFLTKSTTPNLADSDIDPIAAFDNFIWDIEALERLWPAIILSLEDQPCADTIDAEAKLAEFFVRRLPEAFRKTALYQPPVTKAVALADRIDSLCGMFVAGQNPSGSKDPYALRRAALNVLWAILPPTPAVFGYRLLHL